MAMYKVLICGARDWDSPDAIEREILMLVRRHGTQKLLVITGGATGADSLGASLARKHNIHVAEVMALWNTRYRGAGPQRNQVMLDLDPDEVIAFHKSIKASKGTKDMVSRARSTRQSRGRPAKVRVVVK